MYLLMFLSSNPVLSTALLAMCISQVIKFIIYIFIQKDFDITRLFGDGGMPSSHSCVVSSVATLCAFEYGLTSFEFSISLLLAIIVMHDSKGVRLETGKQAKVINEMVGILQNTIELTTDFSHEKLKEFVGHTPLQVFFGAILGIILGVCFSNFLFI